MRLDNQRGRLAGWKSPAFDCQHREIGRIVYHIDLVVDHGKSQFDFILPAIKADTPAFVDLPLFTEQERIGKDILIDKAEFMEITLIAFLRSPAMQGGVRLAEVALLHPNMVKSVQFLKGPGLFDRCFS